MTYFCPLCKQSDWQTITGLENHIWQSHLETRCCNSHKTDFKSPNVHDCKGKLDMATCAAMHVYEVSEVITWPIGRRHSEKKRVEMAFEGATR